MPRRYIIQATSPIGMHPDPNTFVKSSSGPSIRTISRVEVIILDPLSLGQPDRGARMGRIKTRLRAIESSRMSTNGSRSNKVRRMPSDHHEKHCISSAFVYSIILRHDSCAS